MIVNIEQTKTNFDMEWVAKQRDNIIADAKAPFEKEKFQVDLSYLNFESKYLYYNPFDTTYGNKLAERLSFKLFENESLIGNIVGRTQKTGFLKAYAFYEYVFKDKLYFGYEVGFGREGLYLCIYNEDKLIAIIEKELRVINFRDKYVVYCQDKDEFEAIFPFVIYYDATSYGDVMEIAVLSVKEKRVTTIQKELIAKFDPTFIPRIKAMDGIADSMG